MSALRHFRNLAIALDPAGRRIRVELRRIAATLPRPSERVLDLGSGTSPYAVLFPHRYFVSADLVAGADVRCDAGRLPFASRSFDLVICTEVLEHVPDPDATLAEIRRVLSSTGALILTTPLTWGIHESRDFHRWTESGLRQILTRNGFAAAWLVPRGGIFLCLGAMCLVIPWHLFGGSTGRPPWKTALYAACYGLMLLPAWFLAALDRLDRRRYFTQGYAALCRPSDQR